MEIFFFQGVGRVPTFAPHPFAISHVYKFINLLWENWYIDK